MTLQEQIAQAFPSALFATHCSDLYVTAEAGLNTWLKKNYEFSRNVTSFVCNLGCGKMSGRKCYDIPFAHSDYFKNKTQGGRC